MTEQITTPEALDALPVRSVVLGEDLRAHQKAGDDMWWRTIDVNPTLGGRTAERVLRYGPVTVLYRPGAPAPSAEGREALDPAAVQRSIDLTLKNVARYADRTAKTTGERQSILSALADAQDGVASLTRAALAAARDGAWATGTDGRGSLCSSCGIGHDRGVCTPAAPTVTAEQIRQDAWTAAVAAYPTEHVGYDKPVPSTCRCDECYRREDQRDAYMAGRLNALGIEVREP